MIELTFLCVISALIDTAILIHTSSQPKGLIAPVECHHKDMDKGTEEELNKLKERLDQLEVEQGLEMSTPKDDCP